MAGVGECGRLKAELCGWVGMGCIGEKLEGGRMVGVKAEDLYPIGILLDERAYGNPGRVRRRWG